MFTTIFEWKSDNYAPGNEAAENNVIVFVQSIKKLSFVEERLNTIIILDKNM